MRKKAGPAVIRSSATPGSGSYRTGETVPKGRWSGAFGLVNEDRSEGFSDITDIGGMFAFGVTDRVELFGTMTYRRIDADLVPVARNGQPQDYLISQGWSTGLGDVWFGAKFNIRSQQHQQRLRGRGARDGEAPDRELRRRARHGQGGFSVRPDHLA